MKKILLMIILIFTFSMQKVHAESNIALLWIPSNNPNWESILDEMANLPYFKLTIAVSPEMISDYGREKLDMLIEDKQVELVLRICGDPVLPLLFSANNPYVIWRDKPLASLWADRLDEAALRLFYAREQYKESFDSEPRGYSPTGGGTIPEMLPLARTYNLEWIASGKSSSTEFDIYESSDVLIVPFELICNAKTFKTLILPEAEKTIFAVIDETIPVMKAQDSGVLLSHIMHSAYPDEVTWHTVSDAIDNIASVKELGSMQFPAPWTDDYTPWAGAAQQMGAFAAISKAHQDFSIYRNNKYFKDSTVKQINAIFDELEKGENFLSLANRNTAVSGETERTFKRSLNHIYRLMERSVPPSLLRPLSANIPSEIEEGSNIFKSPVTIKCGNSFILITNSEKQLTIPENLTVFPKYIDSYKLFNISSLRIDWNETRFKFRIRNSRATSSAKTKFAKHMIIDIYIDMNHRQRSGSTGLLELRRLRSAPADAWEFALTVNGDKAVLFKATPNGHEKVKSYNARITRGGDIVVEIPRDAIRGNPKLWGYLALVMAKDTDKPDGKIFVPIISESGNAAIDILALDRIGNAVYSLRLPDEF